MNRIYLLPAAAAIALLGACEAHVGNDAAPVDANSTAENRAENGRVSIEAPGFSLKVDVPESILSRADMDSDNPLFYPGAAFGGIHVQGARDAGGEDQVELRFTTSDAIDRVAAWYRDPARRPGFTVATDNREGETIILAGTAEEDRNPFTLRLTPRGGGTEARLLLTDRD